MFRPFLISFFLLIGFQGRTQEKYDITGVIRDHFTKEVIIGVRIGTGPHSTISDPMSGKFVISLTPSNDYILLISAQDYIPKRIPVMLQDGTVDLGILFLE